MSRMHRTSGAFLFSQDHHITGYKFHIRGLSSHNFPVFFIFSLLNPQKRGVLYNHQRKTDTMKYKTTLTERVQENMKKSNWRALAALAAATMIIGASTGCGSGSSSSSDTVTSSTTSAQAEEESGTVAEESSSQTSSGVKASNMSMRTSDTKLLDTADLFSKRDLEQTADLTDAEELSAEDGKTINITSAGVYVISGSAENCTIKVEASKEDKVQLVLDGVNITNESTPAIYVVSADKCFITTTEESENSLKVTGSFTADGETNTDAVIFAKDSIVLNGLGTLSVNSTDNGIACKDNIKITGGTYEFDTTADSVEAKDAVLICGGDFTFKSGKDALHAENNEDDSKGYIYISDGSFDMSAKSDGIQGNAFVMIDGGKFNINASEGIEGTYVQINGGTINISASDDGINAASKSSSYDVAVEFNGGETTLNMSGGDVDAIDANGYVYVNGGTVSINMNIAGMSEPFDYDKGSEFNGGTIIINGEEVSEIPEPKMKGGFGGGNFKDFGGERPDFGEFDGEMPDFGNFKGERPDFGEFDGEMPDFGNFNGKRPDFGGRRGENGGRGNAQQSDEASSENNSDSFTKNGKRSMA